jgi:hypothetical protein
MLTRRALLGSAGCLVLGSCTRDRAVPKSCTDTTGLAAEEVQARAALAYVDAASQPDKACSKCAQYVEATAAGACGGCKLLKGTIHPNGSCKAFAPKT